MPLMLGLFFFRPSTRLNTARTAVIADVNHGDLVVGHGFDVDVVHVDGVNVGHRTVVEVIVVPASAFEAETEVAEAIDDSP
jgi:hypothetical protein